MSRDRLPFVLFLAVLLFAPLAFGAMETWSRLVMEAGMFAAAVLFLVRRPEGGRRYHAVPGLLPLLLLSAWMLLQLVPLPAELVRYLSPARFRQYRETLAFLEPGARLTLSVAPAATLAEFFRLAASITCYCLTVQFLADRRRLRRTALATAAAAAVIAALAVVQKFLSPLLIYGFRAVPANATTTGPFVYHNHFAAFMELFLPLTTALFLYFRPRPPRGLALRKRLAAVFDQQRANTHLLLGFAAVLMVTSIFVSLSRGGIISACLGMLLLLALLPRRDGRDRGRSAMLLGTAAVLAVSWFGWQEIVNRFAELRAPDGGISNGRFSIWRDSLEILRAYPATGSGFGGFIHVYPAFRTLPGTRLVDHAHNDYLELLTQGGVPAGLLGLWFPAVLVWKLVPVYRRRRDLLAGHLFLGAVAGLTAVLFHGLGDFVFQNGAVGLHFFFLAGLAVAAVHASRRPPGGTRLPVVSLSTGWPLGAAVLLLVAAASFHGGELAAGRQFAGLTGRVFSGEMPRSELLELRRSAAAAVRLAPLSARYHYGLANVERLLGDGEAALERYGTAVRLAPLNSEYLGTVGRYLAAAGREAAAGGFLRAALRYEPRRPLHYLACADQLLTAGRAGAAGGVLARLLRRMPAQTDRVITLLLLHGLTEEEIRRLLPRDAPVGLEFVAYLEGVGREALAERVAADIVRELEKEAPATARDFYRLRRYYLRKGRIDEALAVMRLAAERLPGRADVRNSLAALYERQGIVYRAVAEYERALLLDPDNDRAGKALRRLRSRE